MKNTTKKNRRPAFCRACAVFAALAAFAASQAWAFSYPAVSGGIGDMVGGHGVRAYAMGGAGIAGSDEAATLLYNPATLIHLDKKQMGLGFGFAPLVERVALGTLNWYNESNSFHINNFAVAVPSNNGKFAFGLAYATLYDYNYTYKRNDFSATKPSAIIGVYEYTATGAITTITPAVAAALGDKFALGFSYNMISGKTKRVNKYEDTTTAVPTGTIDEIEPETSGNTVNFGLSFSGLKSVRLALNYWGGGKFKVKPTGGGAEADLEIPAYTGIGLLWDFGGRYNTKMAFDFIPLAFSGVKTNGVSMEWADVRIMKVGVEHYVAEDLPVRFGYFSVPFYAARRLETVGFTLGAGYKLSENVNLDGAFEYAKRNWNGVNASGSSVSVDETFRKFLFGANYKW